MWIVVGTVIGAVLSGTLIINRDREIFKRDNVKINLLKERNCLYENWIDNLNSKKYIEEYLLANGYKKIAIYGMKDIGGRLLKELKGSQVEIEYIIDQNPGGVNIEEIEIVKEPIPEKDIDAIIVSVFEYFGEIEQFLRQKTSAPIISIDRIVHRM